MTTEIIIPGYGGVSETGSTYVYQSPLGIGIAENSTTGAVSFSGTVGNDSGQVGVGFSLDLSGFFLGSQTPFSYALIAGTLPAGLALNSSTGVISGTPDGAGTATGLRVRATDQGGNTAQTNLFEIDVTAVGATSTITTDPLKNNAGTLLAELSIAKVAAIKVSNMTLTASWTAQTTDVNGRLTLTDAGLIGDHIILTSNADGTATGSKVYTPT